MQVPVTRLTVDEPSHHPWHMHSLSRSCQHTLSLEIMTFFSDFTHLHKTFYDFHTSKSPVSGNTSFT